MRTSSIRIGVVMFVTSVSSLVSHRYLQTTTSYLPPSPVIDDWVYDDWIDDGIGRRNPVFSPVPDPSSSSSTNTNTIANTRISTTNLKEANDDWVYYEADDGSSPIPEPSTVTISSNIAAAAAATTITTTGVNATSDVTTNTTSHYEEGDDILEDDVLWADVPDPLDWVPDEGSVKAIPWDDDNLDKFVYLAVLKVNFTGKTGSGYAVRTGEGGDDDADSTADVDFLFDDSYFYDAYSPALSATATDVTFGGYDIDDDYTGVVIDDVYSPASPAVTTTPNTTTSTATITFGDFHDDFYFIDYDTDFDTDDTYSPASVAANTTTTATTKFSSLVDDYYTYHYTEHYSEHYTDHSTDDAYSPQKQSSGDLASTPTQPLFGLLVTDKSLVAVILPLVASSELMKAPSSTTPKTVAKAMPRALPEIQKPLPPATKASHPASDQVFSIDKEKSDMEEGAAIPQKALVLVAVGCSSLVLLLFFWVLAYPLFLFCCNDDQTVMHPFDHPFQSSDAMAWVDLEEDC